MQCRATQDEQVRVESSDKMLSTGEGNGFSIHEQYEKAKRYDTER